jgi:exopolysaccharide biosynthesis polyprenyl glycosylphosphotransferase
MNFQNKKEPAILFLGDIILFYVALWLMLLVRYFELPTQDLISLHLLPFSILFAVWISVFYIAGLYEKHTLILRSKIGNKVLSSQIVNSAIAFLFFYLIPYFGITPKTNLFIYILISFGLTILWRSFVFPTFEVKNKQNAILIGTGEEMRELENEVNNNPRYDLYFVSSVDIDEAGSVDFQEEIVKRIYSENIEIVAVDFKNEKVEPLLPSLYNLIFSKVKFIDMYKVYEEIFDRVPLSLVKYSWFLENISVSAVKGYDMLKRAVDIVMSLILALISLVFYPFVIIAIKLEDGGSIFFAQDRVGKNNRMIRVIKFRSMSEHNEKDGISKSAELTKVGKFIRKTRIDELPQLWNVFVGDLSMIGPRPEIPALVKLYEKEIPYYNIRHLIKPGLSGWAQIYHTAPPKFAPQVNETKKKLSYDLYYIKNRSFLLDIKVTLRTIQALISREGV